MSEILELASLCKGSVSVSINPHRDCYQSIEDYLQEIGEIDTKLLAEILHHEQLVVIRAYPDTPVSFYQHCHYDVEQAILDVIEMIK